MHIRPLEEKDAGPMLEWMHDSRIMTYLRMDGRCKTVQDVEAFIRAAADDSVNAHFAIADGTDAYLGTVSLKHIDPCARSAEFAIALGRDAQGKGAGTFGALAILEYGFFKRDLTRIWLEVVSVHKAAIACYERAGFVYRDTMPEPVMLHGQAYTMLRYEARREDFPTDWRKDFAPPALSEIRRLSFQQRGDERGRLVIAECGREVPFDIRRIFYIYGSDPDVIRGRHANRLSEFVLINVAGSSKVRATDGNREEIFRLDQPYQGLYLPRMIWKEMYDFSPDSVLLVLSNERYDPAEYIRNYDAYLAEVKRFA